MSAPVGREAALAAWIGLFDILAEGRLPARETLAACATEDVLFRDPFNEVRGHDAMLRVFAHTLDNIRDVHLTVLDTAWSEDVAFLKWEMGGRVKYLGDWRVTGMSEIAFAADGRVAAHVDYWDAAGGLYARLPVIGPLMRGLLAMGRA